MIVFLVASAGDVVGEDPALTCREIVRQRTVAQRLGPAWPWPRFWRNMDGQPIGFTFEGEQDAFDLLVVLQLNPEQSHHLHGDACAAGDADTECRQRGRPSRCHAEQ